MTLKARNETSSYGYTWFLRMKGLLLSIRVTSCRSVLDTVCLKKSGVVMTAPALVCWAELTCSRRWMNRPSSNCIGDCMGWSFPSGSIVVYLPLCLLTSLFLDTFEALLSIDTDRESLSESESSVRCCGSRRLDLDFRDAVLLAARLSLSFLAGGLGCPRRMASL